MLEPLNKLNNSTNLALLAHYDFLDLCLLVETGASKTHTAKVVRERTLKLAYV